MRTKTQELHRYDRSTVASPAAARVPRTYAWNYARGAQLDQYTRVFEAPTSSPPPAHRPELLFFTPNLSLPRSSSLAAYSVKMHE